jgi:hypothetical protein
MKTSPDPQKMFFDWLEVNFPVVYFSTVEVAKRKQLGWLSSIVSVVNAVASVAPAVINAKTQKRAINLQLEQMKMGLAPLENQAVGLPVHLPQPAPAVVAQQVPQVVSQVTSGIVNQPAGVPAVAAPAQNKLPNYVMPMAVGAFVLLTIMVLRK